MSEKRMLLAENIVFSYGEQEVLNFERFQLYEGDRVGLVGANGVGKTTLLRLLSGELKPDQGSVKLYCEPFYFRQFDETWDSWDLDGKEIKAFGVREQIWQDTVSGGENTRIRLAELFGSDKPVAFLDEPTANLDMAGRMLLVKRLQNVPSFLLVSHDRMLMNALCNKIVEIVDGKLWEYAGNYEDYQAQKRKKLERAQAEYEQYTAEKKRLERVYESKKSTARDMTKKPKNMSYSEFKMRNFIGRHVPADRALNMERSATNVLRRIEHMEVKEKPKEVPQMRPDFRLTNPPRNPIIIRGEHFSFAYDGHVIFDDASFIVENGSKVAVMGGNGVGKSTLLKMIVARNQIYMVPTAKLGFVSQNLAELDFEKTVLWNCMNVSIQKEDVTRTVLARLLLSQRDMEKKVKDLSGGERMKLAFAMLFTSDVNVLILDEPTNYLDLPSLEALEQMLWEYEGTLIFVSHDAEFVQRIATKKLLIRGGKILEEES